MAITPAKYHKQRSQVGDNSRRVNSVYVYMNRDPSGDGLRV
jgi:hypothetical protein